MSTEFGLVQSSSLEVLFCIHGVVLDHSQSIGIKLRCSYQGYVTCSLQDRGSLIFSIRPSNHTNDQN